MKNRLTIVGIGMLVFGLANIFWYWSTSLGFTLENHPFPSQHLAKVIEEHGGHTLIIKYLPVEAAIEDPYWLFWSLVLYGGIVILSIVGIRMIKK